MYVCMYVCMYVRTYVRTYVRMYVCMYGTSVVDYAICDQDIFPSVAHFVVKEPSFFSDHSPVITWLNIETNKNVAPTNDTLKRLPRQFCWENDSAQKFKDVLRSSSTQILIREFLNENEPTTNVNTSLEKVEQH